MRSFSAAAREMHSVSRIRCLSCVVVIDKVHTSGSLDLNSRSPVLRE